MSNKIVHAAAQNALDVARPTEGRRLGEGVDLARVHPGAARMRQASTVMSDGLDEAAVVRVDPVLRPHRVGGVVQPADERAAQFAQPVMGDRRVGRCHVWIVT